MNARAIALRLVWYWTAMRSTAATKASSALMLSCRLGRGSTVITVVMRVDIHSHTEVFPPKPLLYLNCLSANRCDTVKTHLSHGMRKLQANDRTHAAVLGLRWGLIDWPSTEVPR